MSKLTQNSWRVFKGCRRQAYTACPKTERNIKLVQVRRIDNIVVNDGELKVLKHGRVTEENHKLKVKKQGSQTALKKKGEKTEMKKRDGKLWMFLAIFLNLWSFL